MIGKMLRYMRHSSGLNQTELAKNLNIAQTTLSGYETQYSNPDFQMIDRIAKICGFEIIFRKKKTHEEFTVDNIERKDI